MNAWWNGLDVFQQVLYCIAVPSTLLLAIQTIMVLCGFGHGGEAANFSDTSGIDFDGTGVHDISGMHDVSGMNDMPGMHDAGSAADMHGQAHNGDASSPGDVGSFRLFTLQTIVAFLCVYGWTTIIMYGSVGERGMSSLTGVLFGVVAMVAIAKLVQQTARLAANGAYVPDNAIGVTGTVYIPIPAARQGSGKVNVIVQGSLMECDAVTDGDTALATNSNVRVVGVTGETLIVELLNK
jgi:membrane protein implicated in regulation of membrane protease activity